MVFLFPSKKARFQQVLMGEQIQPSPEVTTQGKKWRKKTSTLLLSQDQQIKIKARFHQNVTLEKKKKKLLAAPNNAFLSEKRMLFFFF